MQRNQVQSSVSDAPIIQWNNGRMEVRLNPGQGRFLNNAPGFFSEVGKDQLFDEFCATAELSQIEIRHPRSTGAPAVVLHWDLGEKLRFYPLTSGPVAPTVAASLSARNHAATIEAGIGIRWGRGTGERSRLALRGYLQVTDRLIFHDPVQISVKSKMTDELLAALVDHVRVCEVADTLIDRNKHPDMVQCFELAMLLGPGAEQVWGSDVTTMVFPLASEHPATVDRAYIKTLWRYEAMVVRALEDWPAVQEWAQEFSADAVGVVADEQ